MRYSESIDDLTEADLAGFFVGWKTAPSPQARLDLLGRSHRVVLAWDGDKLAGLITAISDGLLTAYIPLLEVLPNYQRQGIGSELTRRMLQSLSGVYMVDLACDDGLATFYERQGMVRVAGMARRNRAAIPM